MFLLGREGVAVGPGSLLLFLLFVIHLENCSEVFLFVDCSFIKFP